MEDEQEPKSKTSNIKTNRILKTLGWFLVVIIALAMWYISLPVFLGWLVWSKTRWSKKIKGVATAGLVVLFLCLIPIASLMYKSTATNTESTEVADSQIQQNSNTETTP
jgi:NADH:ubiquinone oxidoreductase subunit 6 (subunit J)